MTGAQIIVLSLLGYNLLIAGQLIKNIGVAPKVTTKSGAISGMVVLFLMSAAALYLYMT